jgi:hypothetical protein
VSLTGLTVGIYSLILFFSVYYRIYTANGATQSANSSADDRYLGRISAESVPPPHTVQSLQRCISSSEYIEDNIRTQLFLTVSNQTPMDENCPILISSSTGPGSTPNEAMALTLACPSRQYSERMIVVGKGQGRSEFHYKRPSLFCAYWYLPFQRIITATSNG